PHNGHAPDKVEFGISRSLFDLSAGQKCCWNGGRPTSVLDAHHHLIFPTETVAVRPATRSRSAGTSSSLIRTGIRWANRTQLKVGLTAANSWLLVLRF